MAAIAALAVAAPVSAQSLWTGQNPFPAPMMQPQSGCNMRWPGPPAHLHGAERDFMRDSIQATGLLLRGMCLQTAGLAEEAHYAFRMANHHFRSGLWSLQAEAARKQAEIEARQARANTAALIGTAVIGIAAARGTDATRLQSALSSVEQAHSIQMAQIGRELARLAEETPAEITRTMRIPVFPVDGFLKHIVRIEMPNSHCTGSFVGPRLVLTNFHCLDHRMRVVRDRVESRDTFTVRTWWTFRGERVVPTREDRRTRSFWDDDWAIIEVVENRPDAGDYLQVLDRTPDIAEVMVAGYSGDVSRGAYLTLDLNCPVTRVRAAHVDFRCSTFGGSSGAPLLAMSDQRFVVALNHAGRDLADSANTRGWQNAVRVERFAPTLRRLLAGNVVPPFVASARDLPRFDLVGQIFEREKDWPDAHKWRD